MPSRTPFQACPPPRVCEMDKERRKIRTGLALLKFIGFDSPVVTVCSKHIFGSIRRCPRPETLEHLNRSGLDGDLPEKNGLPFGTICTNHETFLNLSVPRVKLSAFRCNDCVRRLHANLVQLSVVAVGWADYSSDLPSSLMDSRITNAVVKKPSVVRVKPELRRRVRGLLQQAADLRTHGADDRSTPQNSRYRDVIDEVDGSPLAGLLAILLGESQTGENVRRPIQRILTEIDNVLREDVEHKLMIAQERNDRQLEDLTLRLEQTLRQRETSHLREITELHGRIDYLQDQLKESREMNENFERQLENANLELLERSHGMGSTMAEIEDLRKEVKELRLFKAKYRQGMESIDQLRDELEKQMLIAKTTYEEFAKVEKERDELRLEFDKNLQKLRKLNQRRHHAIMAELDEAEDEILT
ncbi:unnamed protein product [Haemonchus placei]|uniref:Centrosomal protein of 135 kDa n=1 Tax=Haemonchus placei TaxID=6290 RepID=A0A0N4WG44_HAEPC|nr:unnamed protein product [Haemonchus placei]